MTADKKTANWRRWLPLAVFAALLCVGLAASNALAAAPTGAPLTKAPVDASSVSKPAPGQQGAPNVPYPCTTNYVITSSTGGFVPGTTDIGLYQDDGVQLVALPFTYYLYNVAYN